MTNPTPLEAFKAGLNKFAEDVSIEVDNAGPGSEVNVPRDPLIAAATAHTHAVLVEFAEKLKEKAVSIESSEDSWFEGQAVDINAVNVSDIDAVLAELTHKEVR